MRTHHQHLGLREFHIILLVQHCQCHEGQRRFSPDTTGLQLDTCRRVKSRSDCKRHKTFLVKLEAMPQHEHICPMTAELVTDKGSRFACPMVQGHSQAWSPQAHEAALRTCRHQTSVARKQPKRSSCIRTVLFVIGVGVVRRRSLPYVKI